MRVSVVCDRCHEAVEGIREFEYTGGFYDTTSGSPWSKFSSAGENIICDACMFADTRYREVYGVLDGEVPMC